MSPFSQGHSDWLFALCWLSDDLLASGARDGRVLLWSARAAARADSAAPCAAPGAAASARAAARALHSSTRPSRAPLASKSSLSQHSANSQSEWP